MIIGKGNLQVKGTRESFVEVKEKQPTIDEGRMYKGVTIEPSKGSSVTP